MNGLLDNTKQVGVICTAALFLILGATAFGYAQQDQNKQNQQQAKEQQDQNIHNQQHAQ